MKLGKLALIAAIACGVNSNNLNTSLANEIDLVSCSQPGCDWGEPDCGAEDGFDSSGCGSGCDSAAGAGDGCGGLFGPGRQAGDEPFSLFGDIGAGINVGGWQQIGYHTAALPLFNSRPDEVQLQQSWLYFDRTIDTSEGFDFGGRLDYVYGTDGPDTQAFGIGNNHWDNQWDNGNDYGHALPQAYVEAGYGDWSVKAGHFFTIIGWEVVAAPSNFFYSHAYTMYNSEPFTHTGALATYSPSDDLTIWGGYTLGWDSGFEDNGDAFLGGFSLGLTEQITMIYATTFGRFGDGNIGRDDGAGNIGTGENGYMHSLIFDVTITDKLQYIFQNDVLDTDDQTGNVKRRTFDINQYLLYAINDAVAIGGRFEWYDADEGIYNSDNDIYALTGGINYRPHSNVLLRPEVRWDWVDGNPDGILENNDDDQFTFGIDSIFLF